MSNSQKQGVTVMQSRIRAAEGFAESLQQQTATAMLLKGSGSSAFGVEREPYPGLSEQIEAA